MYADSASAAYLCTCQWALHVLQGSGSMTVDMAVVLPHIQFASMPLVLPLAALDEPSPPHAMSRTPPHIVRLADSDTALVNVRFRRVRLWLTDRPLPSAPV